MFSLLSFLLIDLPSLHLLTSWAACLQRGLRDSLRCLSPTASTPKPGGWAIGASFILYCFLTYTPATAISPFLLSFLLSREDSGHLSLTIGRPLSSVTFDVTLRVSFNAAFRCLPHHGKPLTRESAPASSVWILLQPLGRCLCRVPIRQAPLAHSLSSQLLVPLTAEFKNLHLHTLRRLNLPPITPLRSMSVDHTLSHVCTCPRIIQRLVLAHVFFSSQADGVAFKNNHQTHLLFSTYNPEHREWPLVTLY